MLTTSVHRQRQQAHVVEDPPMAAEELNEEQQQPPIEEGVTNVKGFPRMERYVNLKKHKARSLQLINFALHDRYNRL